MKRLVRLTLVLTLLMGGFFALPRSAGRVFYPDASAQILPTPTIPPVDDILEGDDDPLDPDDDEDPGEDPDPVPSVDPGDTDPGDDGSDNESGDGTGKGNGNKGDDEAGTGGNPYTGVSHIGGTFSTTRLVGVATQLVSLGVPTDKVNHQVYAPFPIGGEAAWTDTWGAPRFGPGAIVRTHEGQDVFCRYGDPILAPETGIVSYSDGGLGGISARVHTSSSSYWYLTHLSATNSHETPAGSLVEPGDVVGFCGNSGNAATTPPHVHFGWYVNGVAQNPMKMLVKWLHTAERRTLGSVSQRVQRAVRQADSMTTARLFGDAFAPDLSSLNASDSSLLALSAEAPTAGALVFTGRMFEDLLAQGIFPVASLFGSTPDSLALGD